MTRAFRGVSKTMDIGVAAPQHPELAAALAALSEDHRVVVVFRFHLDWSTAETADALDIAEGTVKSRLWTVSGDVRSIPLPE